MRLRRKPWIAQALGEYRDIVLPGPDESLQGNWREIFGRQAALYVELGTGRGQFISELAARHPEINFIGLESQRDVLYNAALKVRERQLINVRLLVFDINNILSIFAAGEVDRLYINFCDPWPKVRHAKRRLTHTRFLEKYKTILISGGELHFKTDNRLLFEYSLEQFALQGLTTKQITFDLHGSGVSDNIMTEYEAKFSQLGSKINRCEVIFK